MDNLEYLQQISKSNRPVAPAQPTSKSNLSLIIKITIGGIISFVAILILGIALGNMGAKSSDLAKQIYIRSNNLNSTITTYNRSLKSSRLRSISSSLSGTLVNTSNQLSNYLTSTSDDSKTALVPSEAITTSETELIDNLNTTLNNAKLNGILDRIYEHQIASQVSLLLALESQLLGRSPDEPLLSIIQQSYASLSTIQTSLEEYDDPSN